MAKKMRVRVMGVDEVLKALGEQAARELAQQIDADVERAARQMANEAANNAPVDTGKLSSSIPKTVNRVEPMTWEFGSDVEYATRQEYEHKTKKGFFRKAVWNNREPLRKKIADTIKKRGR
jgi:hypothetical protein